MRLDKFLKVTRLIKRRTVAKEVADQGRVLINGKEAKASSVVKVGDRLTLQYSAKPVTVQINELAESASKADASSMYTVIDDA